MQIIGFLNNKNQLFNPLLLNNEFKCIIKDKEFNFFISSNGSKEDISYCFRENIHAVLLGCVTNDFGIADNKLRSISDVIIANYLSRGIECLNTIDGSYTIILWDRNRETLFIRGDMYGTKYLYYYFSPEKELTFSNNLDILSQFSLKRDISIKALHEYLRFLDISPPYTIYEEVYLLEPENILISNGKEINLKKIPTTSSNKYNGKMCLTDSQTFFKNLLTKSIEQRVKNSKKTGVFLSGGIDSTLICALASKVKGDIKAYTVGFDNPLYDESITAQKIVNFLKIEHQILKFSLEDDYKAFSDIVSHFHTPIADPAIIPTFQCFKHVSREVDLVLDGTGADSLIGMMPARHIRFILKYSRNIPLKLRILFAHIMKINKNLSSYSALFDFKEPEELLIRWKGWTEEEISMLCNAQCDFSHTRFYKSFKENSQMHPYDLYRRLLSAMQDDRIHQSAIQVGLNVAFPFWDHDVREFTESLPIKYKYSNGTSKVLFRKVIEEIIPPSIWDKPKHGFDYPFEMLLRHNEYKLIKTYLSEESLKEHGFFDISIVKDYLQRFLNGDNTVKFKIWSLVIFQAWYYRHYRAKEDFLRYKR